MSEPLTEKNVMKFVDGAYLTGNYIMPKRIKSAIEGLKSELYPPNPLGDRGPFFTREDILKFIDKWFPIFKE